MSNVAKEVNAEDVLGENCSMGTDNSIELSEYKENVSFTNKEEIELIVEKYDIQSNDDIEEIYYCPIDQNCDIEELGEISREVGKNEYYVKKKKSSEKKGRLLRSSWFEAPGGTMSVSEKVQ